MSQPCASSGQLLPHCAAILWLTLISGSSASVVTWPDCWAAVFARLGDAMRPASAGQRLMVQEVAPQ